MTEKISRTEVIKIYNIEINFLDSLEDSGLIHPEVIDDEKYIFYHELTALERFVNLHYDLEVNIPGLEIINNLLNKIENLHQKNRELMAVSSHFDLWDELEKLPY